ncbi:MAG: hypothetical protein WC479_05780 [Candidatus Izemoplasmatales bacterium]
MKNKKKERLIKNIERITREIKKIGWVEATQELDDLWKERKISPKEYVLTNNLINATVDERE